MPVSSAAPWLVPVEPGRATTSEPVSEEQNGKISPIEREGAFDEDGTFGADQAQAGFGHQRQIEAGGGEAFRGVACACPIQRIFLSGKGPEPSTTFGSSMMPFFNHGFEGLFPLPPATTASISAARISNSRPPMKREEGTARP